MFVTAIPVSKSAGVVPPVKVTNGKVLVVWLLVTVNNVIGSVPTAVLGNNVWVLIALYVGIALAPATGPTTILTEAEPEVAPGVAVNGISMLGPTEVKSAPIVVGGPSFVVVV